ncbi:hypothetical protein Tco_0355037 [Tanacetum coccineum]
MPETKEPEMRTYLGYKLAIAYPEHKRNRGTSKRDERSDLSMRNVGISHELHTRLFQDIRRDMSRIAKDKAGLRREIGARGGLSVSNRVGGKGKKYVATSRNKPFTRVTLGMMEYVPRGKRIHEGTVFIEGRKCSSKVKITEEAMEVKIKIAKVKH